MSKLRKTLALSASDWLLIVRAWMWFGAVEVGLRFLPLQKLLRVIQRSARPFAKGEGAPHRANPERVARCVELAARLHVPNSTCLRKALVLYALLTRRGFDAQLLIGAAKATNGQLDAHAWLECQGKVLLGEPAPGRYSTLCALSGSTPHATNQQIQISL
jgi:Transglutaminase-like superfamily